MEIICSSQTTRALDRQPLKIIVQALWLDSRGGTEKEVWLLLLAGEILVSEADHMWSCGVYAWVPCSLLCLIFVPVD